MSISDELMWRYYELLSFRSLAEIQKLRNEIAGGRNPRDVKVELALELVARFHSPQLAQKALEGFEAQFRRGEMPEDMPEVTVTGAPKNIVHILRESGLVSSGSEGQRSIAHSTAHGDGHST